VGLGLLSQLDLLCTYADGCCRMLTYADVCSRMLTYAGGASSVGLGLLSQLDLLDDFPDEPPPHACTHTHPPSLTPSSLTSSSRAPSFSSSLSALSAPLPPLAPRDISSSSSSLPSFSSSLASLAQPRAALREKGGRGAGGEGAWGKGGVGVGQAESEGGGRLMCSHMKLFSLIANGDALDAPWSEVMR
jgi:hypothetical protein